MKWAQSPGLQKTKDVLHVLGGTNCTMVLYPLCPLFALYFYHGTWSSKYLFWGWQNKYFEEFPPGCHVGVQDSQFCAVECISREPAPV